jgi:hypothetical protein
MSQSGLPILEKMAVIFPKDQSMKDKWVLLSDLLTMCIMFIVVINGSCVHYFNGIAIL